MQCLSFTYGGTHECLVLLLTAIQGSPSFQPSWYTQTLCFKQSVPWTLAFLLSVPVLTMSSPECPPPDAACRTSPQRSWIPWSCPWSLPSLISQIQRTLHFSRYIPFQLVLSNEREGNEREEWTLHAQVETAPGSLFPQCCFPLSTAAVTTTLCDCELFKVLLGHWVVSASKVDNRSYLPFYIPAPRSMPGTQ